MKKKFEIELQADVEIEIDAKVIEAALTPEWRAHFYDFATPGQVAGHIAYNMEVNGCRLSQIDGFANQSDDGARVTRVTWDSGVSNEVQEDSPAPARTKKA